MKELWQAKAEYFPSIGHTISGNPHKRRNVLNSALHPKQKDHVGSAVTVSGECITCSADIVNSFHDHFHKYL